MPRKKGARDPDEQEPSPAGDQISAGNIGEGSSVAQGRGARAYTIRIGDVHLNLLPLVVVLVAALGVLAFLLLRPKHPTQMTGRFNVAVAEVGVVDSSGRSVSSADGRSLGDFLYQRLQAAFAEIDPNLQLQYELWPPEYTGPISGKDPAARKLAAEKLAARINANILIYGVIVQDGENSRFSPEFYVAYKGFELANEITGDTELGDAIDVALPFDPQVIVDVDNPALSARTKALSLITLGLAYYSIDNFDQALDYFQSAESTKGWVTTAGKEVAYLMLGNARVRLASKNKTSDGLDQAIQDFDTALKIKPGYGRAMVGRAGAIYLTAFADPENPVSGAIDPARLSEAEQAFQQALSLTDQPAQANLNAKAHFGLGQVYQARALASGDASWLDKARLEYEEVLKDYDGGNTNIADLASHTHARLGLVAATQKDYAAAEEQYRQAINLASPHYRAVYYANLGEVFVLAGQKAQAIDAYQRAVRAAESLGEEATLDKYTSRLQEIEASP